MISNADDEEFLSAKSWPKSTDLPSFPIVWQCSQHSRWDLKLWNNDYSKKGKISTTKLEKILHEFLTNQRACGNLSRQELVSMAPVFLLNIQPNHRILDMCSSPGSKSRHVLEIMHTKLAASTDFQIPTGNHFILCWREAYIFNIFCNGYCLFDLNVFFFWIILKRKNFLNF